MQNFKRASHRNVAAHEILTQKQQNTLEAPPLPDKGLRRFPSARMSRVKYQQITRIESRQLRAEPIDLNIELRSHQQKLSQKTHLQELITRLCIKYISEKPPQIRGIKEALITKVKRVVAKHFIDRKINEEEYEQQVLQIIEGQAQKISRSKYCVDKYEDCVSKIQKMLDNRLSGLQSIR